MDPERREAWDFDAFVLAYNQLAKDRHGWVWPGEIAPDTLRGWYESTSLWNSLPEFALTRYQLDQER